MTSLIAKSIVDAWVDGFGFLVFTGFTFLVKFCVEIQAPMAEFFTLNVKTSKIP